MECCINSSAINMAGPRITLIRPPILSDPRSGMRRSGMRGINAILITGRLLNKSIPIGADITLVSVMTRIFIINTIAARGKVGIKDSMASGPATPPAHHSSRTPPVRACIRFRPRSGARPAQPTGPGVRPHNQPLVLAMPRRPPAHTSVRTSPHQSWRVPLSPPDPVSVGPALARVLRFSPPVL